MASLRARLLPVLGLLLLVGLVMLSTLLSQRKNGTLEPFFNRSIYNSGPSGYRGWFLACRKAGLQPMLTWERPFDDLREAPSPATMLIAQPYTVSRGGMAFGPAETDKLLAWVEKGNTLVLLDDFQRHGSNALAHRLHLRVVAPQKSPANRENPPHLLRIVSDAPPTKFIRKSPTSRSVTVLIPSSNVPADRKPAILLEDATHRPVLLRIAYGKGTLFLGGLPDLAENAYLRDPANDNLQFLANLLASTGKPILINEFVHGYTEIRDLLSFYDKKTPLGAILSQLAATFLFLAWLGFTRWSPHRRAHLEHEASGLSGYIHAMAGLAYRSRSASLALSPHLARVDRLLHRRHGNPQDGQKDSLLLPESVASDYSKEAISDATHENLPAARLNEALKAARKAVSREERLSHRELLRLSRLLNIVEERLKPDGNRRAAR